jgi:hypothetical protein
MHGVWEGWKMDDLGEECWKVGRWTWEKSVGRMEGERMEGG